MLAGGVNTPHSRLMIRSTPRGEPLPTRSNINKAIPTVPPALMPAMDNIRSILNINNNINRTSRTRNSTSSSMLSSPQVLAMTRQVF